MSNIALARRPDPLQHARFDRLQRMVCRHANELHRIVCVCRFTGAKFDHVIHSPNSESLIDSHHLHTVCRQKTSSNATGTTSPLVNGQTNIFNSYPSQRHTYAHNLIVLPYSQNPKGHNQLHWREPLKAAEYLFGEEF